MTTRVQVHDLTGQLAGRRFSSADRRQEAGGGVGGFGEDDLFQVLCHMFVVYSYLERNNLKNMSYSEMCFRVLS